MKTALRFFLLLLIMISPRGAHAESAQTYLRYLPDVPLMPAMVELEEQALIFDKAEGRVIESAAVAGDLSEKAVNEFYGQTLPGLGWTTTGSDRFLRNGEQLIVKCEKLNDGGPDGVVVRFSLSPKQGQSPEKNF